MTRASTADNPSVEGTREAVVDPHPWRLALGLGAALIVMSGLMAFWWAVTNAVPGSWMIPGDVWVSVPAAHYEDVVATAGLLLCASLCVRRRWIPAAIALSVAILFKQWALLAVPMVAIWAPPRMRVRVVWYSVLLPGALVALCLALDWSNASVALTSARATPHLGHHQLWVTDTGGLILGAPLRVGSFVLAALVAWWLRNTRDPVVMPAAFGTVLVGRLLFEPTLFSYYLAPSLTFVLVVAFVGAPPGNRRWLVSAGLALALDLWFAVHPPLLVWWVVALALAVAVYGPIVRIVWNRRSADPTPHEPEPPGARAEPLEGAPL